MSPARTDAGRRATSPAGSAPVAQPPLGQLAFLGVAIASLGGPLALAALYVPTIVADVTRSAGFVALLGSVAFAVPLLVWLRYARHVAGSGGLYDYVRAAVGRRPAMLQAGLWIASYALYLIYTTAAIVYDTLPTVLPWIRPWQTTLEIAIPVLLAAIMLAGRTATIAVLGLLAVGQLVLVAVLAAVTIGHDAPAHSFAVPAASGDLTKAGAQVALLYVCGSLPLYLGGELRRPRRTIRRLLPVAFVVVALSVTAAVFPLAENPAFTRAAIPGMSVAQVFSGRGLAVAVGVGVAVSTAGVMLVEFLALTRLLHRLTARPMRQVIGVLSAVLVVSAPITLIDPDRIYDDLLKPSLVALWLSQLVVFVAYPWFGARHDRLRVVDVVLAAGASAFAIYGIYATFQSAAT
jgi:amino acid transporter